MALADVYPKGSPQDASTSDLLHNVRDQVVPASERGTGLHVLVGGQTAIFDDFATVLSRKLPLFLAIVIGLSFLLLMTVFRSVVIPAVAAAMNLLSAAAAFGVVTAVFQDGIGASLLGIDKTGPIEAFVPVFMFAILFGLSMDYEVFLVTRIYEEWHRRRNNREAVAHGLAATGRTITAAAAIMVLVFGAFILGGAADHRPVRGRSGERGPDRRPDRPLGARARADADHRRRQLVAAGVARPDASRTSGSREPRRGPTVRPAPAHDQAVPEPVGRLIYRSVCRGAYRWWSISAFPSGSENSAM